MPFCPKCRYEYKEGVKICSDCGVELVNSLESVKIAILLRDEDTINEAFDFLVKNGVEDIEKGPSESGENLFEIRVPENQAKRIVGMLNVYYREIHTATEEELEVIEQAREAKLSGTRYVDSGDRAENYKSGASVLIGVGAIGLVLLVLVNLGIISLPLPSSTKNLVNVVMGALFALFVVLGINSFISYKKYKNLADSEDDLEDKINKWADYELKVEDLTADETDDTPEEVKFFARTEKLRNLLNERFPNLEESFAEHIVEDLYDRIFGCE